MGALVRALMPPAVQHLHLSLGLVGLCAADGGTTHGLDAQLYGRLAPRDEANPQRHSGTNWTTLVDTMYRWGTAD
jgi:hypothetical protein